MTIINKKWTEEDVISDAIGDRTYREAAEWLNEKLPFDYQRTHQSVYNWINVHDMPQVIVDALLRHYDEDDARYQLAAALNQMRSSSALRSAQNEVV